MFIVAVTAIGANQNGSENPSLNRARALKQYCAPSINIEHRFSWDSVAENPQSVSTTKACLQHNRKKIVTIINEPYPEVAASQLDKAYVTATYTNQHLWKTHRRSQAFTRVYRSH